jgi:hypothetical protein
MGMRWRAFCLEAADQSLLDTLGNESPGSGDFVKGIAGARFYEEKEPWALKMVETAVKGGLPETAIVELLLAIYSQRSTWDAAAALGEGINAMYWKDADFNVFNQTHEDIEYAIEQMVIADRAPEVVERIANDSSSLAAGTILGVLHAATGDPLPTGGNGATMFQWGVARLFTRLDKDEAVSDDVIAQLEWQYLAILEHSERPAKALHTFMSTRPTFSSKCSPRPSALLRKKLRLITLRPRRRRPLLHKHGDSWSHGPGFPVKTKGRSIRRYSKNGSERLIG